MNIDEAIRAHTFWKVTLKWMINGQRPVDGQKIGAADQCELGRWIHSERNARPEDEALSRLAQAHDAFHRQAGEVIRLIQAGETAAAEQLLAQDSPYSKASADVVAALKGLETLSGRP